MSFALFIRTQRPYEYLSLISLRTGTPYILNRSREPIATLSDPFRFSLYAIEGISAVMSIAM